MPHDPQPVPTGTPGMSAVENIKAIPPGETGLFCWRDKERACGAECMAFLPQVPPSNDYIGQQWAHCMLLVAEHRKGKHLVILSEDVHKLHDELKRGRASALLPDPPTPR